jgi:outer membrane immunogenic protein
MHKKLLAACALIAISSSAALAADLPGRRGAVAPTPNYSFLAYNWSGFYVGGNLGLSFGRFPVTGGGTVSSATGFIGGGQLGYNYQIGQIVVGAEADLQYSGMSKRVGPTTAALNYFGTARARLGYAFDRFMVYGTGGLAYGDVRIKTDAVGRDDKMLMGWTAGVGMEYAFTQNITARAEYLYTDLGNRTFTLAPGTSVKAGAEFSTVRTGLNYKF